MNQNVQAQIKKILDKEKHAGYVVITCAQPAKDGNMTVEMIYSGEPELASYLVNTAQGILDEHISNDYSADIKDLEHLP